jgi:hypothetical protein
MISWPLAGAVFLLVTNCAEPPLISLANALNFLPGGTGSNIGRFSGFRSSPQHLKANTLNKTTSISFQIITNLFFIIFSQVFFPPHSPRKMTNVVTVLIGFGKLLSSNLERGTD